MTRNETLKILSILKNPYPTFYRDISKEEAVEIADLWYSMFKEESSQYIWQSFSGEIGYKFASEIRLICSSVCGTPAKLTRHKKLSFI